MGLPVHVQSSGWVDDVSNVATITVPGVTDANNTILVVVAQTSATPRTYTVTSASGTITFDKRQDHNPGRVVQIWSGTAYTVTPPTDNIIVVTASGSSVFSALAVEVSGLDLAGIYDVSDEFTNAAGQTTHFSAASGSIDTAANTYCIAVGVLSASSGGFTAGTNWNSLGESSAAEQLAQYRISASALTDERGIMTTVTGRASDCAVASFKGTSTSFVPFPRPRGMSGGMRPMSGGLA